MTLSPTRLRAPAAAACAVLVACLVLTAAISPGSSAARPRATAASTPHCSTPGLVVWLDTQGNGTAGSSYYKLELTNLSGSACTISGFTGVSAITLGGRQLGSAARREGSGSASVTLGNGASAVASLRIVVAGNFPASKCAPVTAAGLRVYPPGQKTAKTIPFPFEACSRRGPAYLAVGAVRKG